MTKRSGNLSRLYAVSEIALFRHLSGDACAFCTLWCSSPHSVQCAFFGHAMIFWLGALAGMLPGNFHELTSVGERGKEREKKRSCFFSPFLFSEGILIKRDVYSIAPDTHTSAFGPGHVGRCSSVEPSHRDQKRCETIRETLLFVRDGVVSQMFLAYRAAQVRGAAFDLGMRWCLVENRIQDLKTIYFMCVDGIPTCICLLFVP